MASKKLSATRSAPISDRHVNGRVITAARKDVVLNQSELGAIIQPQVKDRWLGLMRRNYTADTVRTILDGVNSNRIYFLHAMFELLEETWPRVGQNLYKVRSDVSRADWIVQPYSIKGQKATESAQEKAKFVEQLLWDMKTNPETLQAGLVDTIYNLADAYGKGLAVLEIDWERKADGVLAPLGTRWIRPVYFDYPIRPEAQERLMLSPSGRPETDLQPFPSSKFIIGIYSWRSGALASKVGLLRSLAPWWVYMNFSVEWLLALGQIFGIPIRWANYNTPKDMAQVSKMLEQMGGLAWGAFPAGVELNLHESAKATGDNPNAYLLQHCDTLADLVVLGQTLGQQVSESGGNRALGEVHERVLTGRTKHVAFWAGEILTQQLIRPIIQVNYGNTEELPVLVPKIEEQRDPKALAERDKILFVDMKLPVSKEHLYQTHNVPQPQDTDELYEAPDPVPAMGPGGAAEDEEDPAGARSRSEDSFAAIDSLPVSDEVKAALRRMPDDLREKYVGQLVQASGEDLFGMVKVNKPRFKRGQEGGGRFMAKERKEAIGRVKEIMNKWPSEGQRSTERYIRAFGLPDNEAEFRSYSHRGLAEIIDDRARGVGKLTKIEIGKLKTTQSRIDGHKVEGMLQSTADSTPQLARTAPIVIKRSNKLWLWDGHHRAAKELMLGRNTLSARLVDVEDTNEVL